MGGGLILPQWLVLDFPTVTEGSTTDTTETKANCYQVRLERWLSQKKGLLTSLSSEHPGPLSYSPWLRNKILCVDELLSRQIMWTTEGSAVRQAYGFAAKQRLMEITTSAVNSWMVYSSRETPPLGLQTINQHRTHPWTTASHFGGATVIEYGLIAAVIPKEDSDKATLEKSSTKFKQTPPGQGKKVAVVFIAPLQWT